MIEEADWHESKHQRIGSTPIPEILVQDVERHNRKYQQKLFHDQLRKNSGHFIMKSVTLLEQFRVRGADDSMEPGA